MSHPDDVVRRAKEHTITQWEEDHPSWRVLTDHPVIVTFSSGQAQEEIEVTAAHRETGEVLYGVGPDLVMALALVSLRISER